MSADNYLLVRLDPETKEYVVTDESASCDNPEPLTSGRGFRSKHWDEVQDYLDMSYSEYGTTITPEAHQAHAKEMRDRVYRAIRNSILSTDVEITPAEIECVCRAVMDVIPFWKDGK